MTLYKLFVKFAESHFNCRTKKLSSIILNSTEISRINFSLIRVIFELDWKIFKGNKSFFNDEMESDLQKKILISKDMLKMKFRIITKNMQSI